MFSPFWFDVMHFEKKILTQSDAQELFDMYFISLKKNQFSQAHVERGVKGIEWEEHWGEDRSSDMCEMSK